MSRATPSFCAEYVSGSAAVMVVVKSGAAGVEDGKLVSLTVRAWRRISRGPVRSRMSKEWWRGMRTLSGGAGGAGEDMLVK